MKQAAINILVILLVAVCLLLVLMWANLHPSPVAYLFLFLVAISSSFLLVSMYYVDRARRLVSTSPLVSSVPSVTVVLPCYGPSNRFDQVMESVINLDYPSTRLSVVVLDDSPQEILSARARAQGCTYYNYHQSSGKGGALNLFLSECKTDLVAIFDADEVVTNPQFLNETVGYFHDPLIAFVQTNKDAMREGIFKNATTLTNNIFFNFVEPVNSANGFHSFTGSCGILRTSALHKVGGFPSSVVEDVAISFELKLAGYKAVHHQATYAQGVANHSFRDFVSKQKRYIYGLTRLLPRYILHIKNIPLTQQGAVFFHFFGLHYVSLFQLLFLFSTVFVLSIPGGFFPGIVTLASLLISTILLSYAVFPSFRSGFIAYCLNYAVLFDRLNAAAAALLNSPSQPLKVRFDSSDCPVRNSLIELGACFIILVFAYVYSAPQVLVICLWFLAKPAFICIDRLGWWR